MIRLDPWTASLILAVIAAVAVAAKRGRRQLLGTAAAAAALLVLALTPTPGVIDDEVLVLTRGADAGVLAEEERALDPSRPTYSIGREAGWPRWVRQITDIGRLRGLTGVGRTVVVAGHGLDPWDVERLNDGDPAQLPVRIVRAAIPPPPPGVRQIDWRRDLAPGEPLRVRGLISGEGLEGAVLRLSGPGASVERPLDAAADETAFDLEVVPPGAGRFLFALELDSDRGIERVGRIDVSVDPAEPSALLWVESAPSFETRHVKNWLAAAGAPVAVRSTISRDRYRYEFHHLERSDISRITADRLSGFDLLVVDTESWHSLRRTERDAVEQAVRQGGLGLVVRLDPENASENAPFGVEVQRIAGIDRLMVRPARIDPGPENRSRAANPPEPLAIAPYELGGAGSPLFRDSAGRVLAERRRLGDGAVAVTLLRDSYRWVLEGRGDLHRDYWMDLFEAVAPPGRGERWLPPPGPVLVDEPTTVTLAGEPQDEIRLVGPGGDVSVVPMRQHPTLPHRFSATLWPRETGWHRLMAGAATASFYVGESDAWEAWRLERRRGATALAAARTAASLADPSAHPRPWLRLLALGGLITALALAWIGERASR